MQYTVDGVPADLSGSTLKALSVHRLCVLLIVTMMLQVTVTEALETYITNNENNYDTDLEDCECIPFGECKNSPVLTNHGKGLFNYRSPGVCGHPTKICCKTSEKTLANPMVMRTICGENNMNSYFKINTNDYETQYGEFPWMMVILKLDEQNQSMPTVHCGGSLIHPEVVLTAAHCIRNYDLDMLLVRGGEWDLQAKFEFFPTQDRQILKKIVHNDYYGGNGENDVALIVVKEPFELTNIRTLCLPNQNMMFENEKCISGGWGKHVTADFGKTADILKKIDLPIVSSGRCSELYKKKLGPHYNLHESMICAGGEIGKDTCKGDGGGPLMCPITGKTNQFYQAGIVSWGINCGTKLPGVYTNVALFRNWIDDFMDNEGFDKTFYNSEFIPDKNI